MTEETQEQTVETVETVEAQEGPTPEELEAQKAAQDEARKYGWRPKEEFDRDPDNWVDADRFLELPQTHVKMVRDELRDVKKQLADKSKQLDSVSGMTKAALERVRQEEKERYEKQISDLRAAQARAAEEADVDTLRSLQGQEDQVRANMAKSQAQTQTEQPEAYPEVTAYREANTWTQNPLIWREAVDAVDMMPKTPSTTVQDQIAYAEGVIKQKYPHLFEQEKPKPMSQKVDGGGLGLGAKKAKGANDLPAEAKQIGKEFVEEGLFKSLDDYAKQYFEMEAQ